MKKINAIVFASLVLFLFSCNSDRFEEHTIGDNLIDKSTEVLLIDTFTVKSSTVKLDSVKTSGYESVLFGKYNDDFFGKVRSEFYGIVDLGTPFSQEKVNGNNDQSISVRFDSLAFIVYTDGRYYGDTLLKQSMTIHKVLEEMELPKDKNAFYGHDKFDYEPDPLMQKQFFAKPVRQSVFDEEKDKEPDFDKGGIYLKMDSDKAIALGEDIIKKVNAGSDTVSQIVKWKKYFKGIVLRPGDANSAMISLALQSGKMKIRLYYSNIDYTEVGKQKFHDFPVSSGSGDNLSFMNYTSDKTSTPQNLGRIVERTEDLSSEQTDNLAFIQGGIGFLMKVRIPYIDKLNTLGLTGGILKAELIFYPKDESYDRDVFMLPKSPLNIFKTDDKNQILQAIVNPANDNPITSIYNYNSENKDESFYSIELTNYINEILLQGQKYEDALLVSLPLETIGNSFERLVVENDKDSDFRIRLKVTYVVQR